MNALFIFAATFAVVLFLGLQSLNVNGGHKAAAVLTSFGIGAANLFILKVMPGPTGWPEITAYLTGGPLGILASMHLHPWMVRMIQRRTASNYDWLHKPIWPPRHYREWIAAIRAGRKA